MKEKPGLLFSLLVLVLVALPVYNPFDRPAPPPTVARAQPAPDPSVGADAGPVAPPASQAALVLPGSSFVPAQPDRPAARAARRTTGARTLAAVRQGDVPLVPPAQRERVDARPRPRPVSHAAIRPAPRMEPGPARETVISPPAALDTDWTEPSLLLPASRVYPDALRQVPLAPRTVSTETAAYLAGHEVRAGDRSSSHVALTIDCEQNPRQTRQMLQILQKERVHATFFVSGYYVYLYPDVVGEIAAAGHELGNHSFTHPRFSAIDPSTATLELLYTEAAVDRALGRHLTMHYVRFPYGERDDAVRQHAAALGYRSAFWDMDPQGWSAGRTAADVVDYVRRLAHPGGVVIMHCGSASDVEALPDVLLAIREQGLIPGTLSDALAPWSRLLGGGPQRLVP